MDNKALYGFTYRWDGDREICFPPHKGIVKDGIFVPENNDPPIDEYQLMYRFTEESAWSEFMRLMNQTYYGFQARMAHILTHAQQLWKENGKSSWKEPALLLERR